MARRLFLRQDGTATNKAAAVGPVDDASKCMNLTVHNSLVDNLLPDDEIIISNRGGEFDCSSILLACPDSGLLTQPIIYQGEENHIPVFNAHDIGGICLDSGSLDHIIFNDLILKDATSSVVLNDGTSVGLIYNRCKFSGSGDQNTQNIDTVEVTYNDCETFDAADDGHSIHDNAKVILNGGRVYDNAQGINSTSTGNAFITCYGTTIENNTQFEVSAQNVSLYRCIVRLSAGGEGISSPTGNMLIQSTIIDALTNQTTDRLVDYTGAGNVVINNSVFYNQNRKCQGVWCRASASSIVANNTIFQGLLRVFYTFAGVTVTANNCCYHDNTDKEVGDGSLIDNNPVDQNPLMVDPANDNFKLTKDSPCINAGTDSVYSSEVLDFDEKPITDNLGNALGDMPIGAHLFQAGYQPVLQPVFQPIFQNIFQGIHK
jgi:hypothetical protein